MRMCIIKDVKHKRNQRGFHLTLLPLFILVLGIVVFAGWKVFQKNKPLPTKSSTGQSVNYDQKASRELTGGNCSGAGSVQIGSPMAIDQIGYIQPYGLVIGGHVTPIDHQYYTGLDMNALRDTYDVLAPADGKIVNISHRGDKTNTPPHTTNKPSSDEYRLVFVHTCSFLTYEDLVTSLTPEIIAKLPGGHTLSGSDNVNVDIPVKKGEVIGHIGGQTLDFAVWDLSKKLTGFVNPSSYDAESWKIFTAPTSDYLDSASKSKVLAKYLRTAAPIDGKIDYDVDGKLIGNWFLQGSGGYHGANNHDKFYWSGHLSIAPDYLDPSAYIASIGNYGSYAGATINGGDGSDAAQFLIKAASPNPKDLGVGQLAKYELVQKVYELPDGTFWNINYFATGAKATAGRGSVTATIAAQLTDKRTLKFEVFPGKTADQVPGFDSTAKTYTR